MRWGLWLLRGRGRWHGALSRYRIGTLYTVYDICIYIYIERERKREINGALSRYRIGTLYTVYDICI